MMEDKEKLALFLYFDADDSSLEKNICQNVLDVTKANLSDNIEIYVYLDRLGQDTRKDQSEGTKTFDSVYKEWWKDEEGKEIQGGGMYGKVVKDGDSFKVKWEPITSETEKPVPQDSSLPLTLQKFLEWGTVQTSASHYVVWMSDHGAGVIGGFSDEAIKENSMIPMQYANVLKKYKEQLDVVVFDCCLMANAEALAELSGTAKYVVSSEQQIAGKGLDYTNVLNAISKLGTMDAQTLAQTIIIADTTANSGSVTLSSSIANNTLLTALQKFGQDSSNFTQEDWSALVDTFHNPNYYYSGSYADLLELLQDSALADDTLSQNLKDAVSSLKAAAKASVDVRKQATDTVNTQHGYGVMVYAPVRQQTEWKVNDNFAYLSMLQAGNDTPWSNFLYTLYDKAKAEDKVYRTMPDNVPINPNVDTEPVYLWVDETGYVCHDEYDDIGYSQMINLTDTGLKQDCNYVINQEVFLYYKFDDAEIKASDSYNMVFTFEPFMKTTKIDDKSITINVYKATVLENGCLVIKEKKANYQNTDGNTITVQVDPNDDNGIVVWQIISDKSVKYSFAGNHLNAEKKEIMADEDRFDREEVAAEVYGYHSFKYALTIKNNNTSAYIGALAVTKDTLTDVNTDYFSIDRSLLTPYDLEITVEGTKSKTVVKEGLLKVELFNTKQEKVADAKETDTGKYTFDSSVTFAAGYFVTVSLKDDANEDACYYSISHKWREDTAQNTEQVATTASESENGNQNSTETITYPDGYIDSTSIRSIPEKSGSYAIFWSNAHSVTTDGYKLQFSLGKDFNTAFNITLDNNHAVKLYNIAPGTSYNWRVRTGPKDVKSNLWTISSEQLVGATSDAPRSVAAQNDYVSDIMMTHADGVWEKGYVARNCGFTGTDWTGTREAVVLAGKNKITDVFYGGGTDSALLVLTDDKNGDAVFVDDIYSSLPDGTEAGSRLTNITTVYAGDGDDVVDFTSQRYASGDNNQKFDKVYLHGGDGNDVLWAPDTSSWLFGDAGNDNLTGSSYNDVLVGGIGNDTMYGCGGDLDTFCFCKDWGNDVVYQLSDSNIVLWFSEGSKENWDEETLTYTDGDYSVKVFGIENEDIELRFGETSQEHAAEYNKLVAAGAFDDQTTSKIFESTLA